MKVPSSYKGVLLFDDAIPKASIKLNTEQKALQKQITALIQSNLGKHVAREPETQRLVSVFIILLNLDMNTSSNANSGYRCFRLFQLSKEGKLITCKGEYKSKNKEIKLVGMDNFRTTTCYLDALLVALFYSTSSFDFLLDSSIDPNLSPEFQQQIDQLKIIMRFIVNMMRAGDHINVNIMYQLLLVLNSLGCDMVLSGKQQDSLQAFEFLAESLSLPLLTLKLDILHSGKLNVNDDLRLIGERSILISIPTSAGIIEKPVTLEECLNSYFNNSITVRRHLDQKLSMSTLSTAPAYGNLQMQQLKESSSDCISESAITSKDSLVSPHANELEEYEKVGILTLSSSSVPIPRPASPLYTLRSDVTTPLTSFQPIEADIGEMEAITPERTASEVVLPTGAETDNKLEEATSIVDFSPTASQAGNTPLYTISSSTMTTNENSPFAANTDIETINSGSVVGSFKNVSEKLERQRTRSSTLASVLNNVQTINPTRITRRSSSVSNSEVSLPAWMYLQLLPYYTDPEVKLTVENHEEYYRRRISRSKTIDSVQLDPNVVDKLNITESQKPLEGEHDSYFNKRYSNKRPVIPICLKRYTWNERGKPIKINRKVVIPEVIKYPYFIAEDKTKPGFVDFKRSFDHKAPRGSFMLVLQSCVCHRGNSINSGHYVSVVRKKQFDISSIISSNASTTSSEWLIFNDMEIGKDKAKSCTFEEAMEAENPYILFYEIYEIKNDGYSTPVGAKDSYWSRKQSVVSGFSGISEHTLQEESSDNGSLTKHVMHLSLAGLALSKSKSRITNNESDELLDDYYWYDTASLNHVTESGINSFATQTSNKIYPSNASGFVSSSNVTSSSMAASIKSSAHPSINEEESTELPQVHVIEVSESVDTNNTSLDGTARGHIDYVSESSKDNKLSLGKISKQHKQGPILNIMGKSKIQADQKSVHSGKSSSTIKERSSVGGSEKRHSVQLSRGSKKENKVRPKSYIGTTVPSEVETKKSTTGSKGTVRKFLKKVFN